MYIYSKAKSNRSDLCREFRRRSRDFRRMKKTLFMQGQSPPETANVGTSNECRDFRWSKLPTNVGTSDVHSQQVSRTIDAGTPGLGRDFRLSGVLTHVRNFDIHSHRAGYDWESALPARVMTSDCREFRLTSGLPTPTVTEKYSMCS